MRHGPQSTPISLAVVAALLVSLILLGTAGALGGSYYLSARAIQRAVSAEDQLHLREVTFQIRQAIPTCRAITSMDQASHVSARDFPSPPHNTYDRRLSAAIHAINTSSHCPLILRDVARHVPYTTILRQIQGASAPAHRNAGTGAGR